LRLWLAEPDFARSYRHARKLVLEQAITVVQSASLSAVAALVRNLTCGKPGAEIAAANSLLQRSMTGLEIFDVLSRLEALEQAQQAGANHAYGNAQANGAASRGGPLP